MLTQPTQRRVVMRLPRADGGVILVTCTRPFDEAVTDALQGARLPIVSSRPMSRQRTTGQHTGNGTDPPVKPLQSRAKVDQP